MADTENKPTPAAADQNPKKSKEEQLDEIEAQLTEVSERLEDLKQQFFKGKLAGPECDRLGLPLRRQRRKLVEEKYNIIGGRPNPNELGESEDDE